MNICTVSECWDAVHGRGLCSKHWQRMSKHGRTDTPSLKDKFLSWIKKDKNGCWILKRGADKNGYTRITFNWRRMGGHRLAYEIFIGPLEKGKLVCHRCDVPSCVNPKHLFLGTYSDNLVDCVRKGRHPGSKLNIKKVMEIKNKIKKGEESLRSIARFYGIAHNGIQEIRDGKRWAHVK